MKKTILRKGKRTTSRHFKKITLIEWKDMPIGGLFYIRGWKGQKAIKTSELHAHWKKFDGSRPIRFKYKSNDKIKPVFYAGTKNIVVEGD